MGIAENHSVAVGLSQTAGTRLAVREASERAAFQGKASWILAFMGRRHRPDVLLAELNERFPGVPVFGGSCVGALGVGRIGYSGNEVALAIFDESLGLPDTFVVEQLADNEHEAGEKLGEWLQTHSCASETLLFYDVVRPGGGINIGSRLLDGIYSIIPETGASRIHGAGLISDFQVTDGFLFAGDRVIRNAALLMHLPRTMEVHSRVMHGCTPVSSLLTVTRAEGAQILELDGRPAVSVLRELAGAKEDAELALAFSVLLGRRASGPFTPHVESEYINRLIIDTDASTGSISLFEEDIRTGDQVQVMVRNNSLLMESVRTGVAASLAETNGKRRLMALYIDCAGRASAFTGSEKEEAEQVSGMSSEFPVMGFYVGREIAPFDGRSRPLDWTGVLLVLSERSESP